VVVHHRTELSPRRARVLLVTRTALMAPAVIYALTLLYPPPPLFTMPDSPGYSDLPDPDDNPAHVHQSDQKSPTTPAEHTSPADQPPAPAPPAASEDET
jgi:hypothetical protein